MGLLDNILLALSSLKANKMRALLTMLGIIIGIGSVIGIVTVGDSMTGSITDSMSSFGINNITVSLTSKSSSSSDNQGSANVRMFGPSTPSAEDLITSEMIEEYRFAYADQIKAIALSENIGSNTAKFDINTSSVNIKGVNVDVEISDDLTILSGRFLKQEDLDSQRKVCVVSDYLANELYGTTHNVIGNTLDITINQAVETFYIIGVYEYAEDEVVSLNSSSTTTTSFYIPITLAKKINHSDDGYQSFTVLSTNDTDNSIFLANTKSFFASFYTRNSSYTVNATNLQSMVETMTSMLSTITLAIGAIAAISLLVGGIGVMNIMLVSITERTREIGTRKALGASESIIRFQFIVESVIICLIGGILGVLCGIGIGELGANLLGYAAKPSVMVCVLAVAFSMTIGVFFGYYPASKAAKLDPIEALRYE